MMFPPNVSADRLSGEIQKNFKKEGRSRGVRWRNNAGRKHTSCVVEVIDLIPIQEDAAKNATEVIKMQVRESFLKSQ